MIVQPYPPMFLENPYRLLIPGQWVRSRNALVWHHGIITGFGWDFATHTPITLVTHNRPLIGVAETPLQKFSQNYIEIFRQPKSDEHGPRVATIASANWGKPYAVFNQNCEHFASFCYYEGQGESQQVQAFMAALGVVGVTAWAMSSARSSMQG